MEFKVFTVTEFSNLVKMTIEETKELETICVKGEVSNFKLNTSGHLYFTLKDDNSTVKCIMFKNYALKNNIDIKDGDKIFVLRKNYSILSNSSSSYKKRWCSENYMKDLKN